MPARSFQLREWQRKCRVSASSRVESAPWEIAGGLLSLSTLPAHRAPQLCTHLPHSAAVLLGHVVKPGLARAQSWYRHLLAKSAEKEDITHCWKLFFPPIKNAFLPLSPVPFLSSPRINSQ